MRVITPAPVKRPSAPRAAETSSKARTGSPRTDCGHGCRYGPNTSAGIIGSHGRPAHDAFRLTSLNSVCLSRSANGGGGCLTSGTGMGSRATCDMYSGPPIACNGAAGRNHMAATKCRGTPGQGNRKTTTQQGLGLGAEARVAQHSAYQKFSPVDPTCEPTTQSTDGVQCRH